MPQQLPLVPSIPNYRVATTLGDDQFILDVRWNGRDEAWYMDILTQDGDMIRAGIKLVLGAILGVGADSRLPAGRLIASDLAGTGVDAGLDDMGVRVAVYFYPQDELDG